MKTLKTTELLWRSLHAGILDSDEQLDFIHSFHMPDKGYGFIQVANADIEQSLELLKTFVGENEFNYYVTGFISDVHYPIYYGKFEIEDLSAFLFLLLENEIKIINCSFSEEYFLI